MTRPFGRISLALSGGGTRAAGYHLGVMNYLDRLGLLTDVAIISGASGGAFVVSTYAMSQAKGWSWDHYRNWMLERLRLGQMAQWVLQEFSVGEPRGLSGRRTIISALAENYDRHFFEGFRFGDLVDNPPGHLHEVVINATDFRSGLGFRFQRHAPAGNAQVPIDPKLLRHARLADVMAASSCLPGAMEPFFFPEDFVWEGAEALEDAAELRRQFSALGCEAIPLMDGGLYDNQGLEGLMTAAARLTPKGENAQGEDTALEDAKQEWRGGAEAQRFVGEFDLLFQRVATGDVPEEPPGLVFVSDASNEPDPIYRAGFEAGDARPLRTVKEPPRGWATLSLVRVASLVLLALSAASILGISGSIIETLVIDGEQIRFARGIALYFFPLLLAIGTFAAMVSARRFGRHAMDAVDTLLRTEGRRSNERAKGPSTWAIVRRLPLSQLPWLLKIRLSSAMAMLSDIYFVRHRILGYALLYGFPGWRRQLLSAEIFSLGLEMPSDSPPPTEAMKRMGADAANEPPAFWFDEPDQLETLVATGQMSACRNLITFLSRRKLTEAGGLTEAETALLTRTTADWERFRKDPLASVPRAARPTVGRAALDLSGVHPRARES